MNGSAARQFLRAECHLPTLLVDNVRNCQFHKTVDKLSSPGQMKVKDFRCAVPEKTSPPRAFRILGEKEKIESYYVLGQRICGGAMGKLFNAKKKKVVGQDDFLDSRDYVVKVLMKKTIKEDESHWRTVMTRLMASKVCPHLLEIKEIFEDKKAFYIVMPKCSGGELFNFLEEWDNVQLSECKRIMREILIALDDLHSLGLIHGDVKPENIMFDKPENTVKLIDFDTCQLWSPNAPQQNRFNGTPMYIAPETLMGRACPQSDLFAVGVILFIMITGEMPWSRDLPGFSDTEVGGANAKLVHDAIQNEIEEMDWHESPWPEFPSALDLCKKLMAFDPLDRIPSAAETLSHPWLNEPDVQ